MDSRKAAKVPEAVYFIRNSECSKNQIIRAANRLWSIRWKKT